jgi:ubiquinone/menaquinone biosynthesis C-methylase UbiE
VEKIVSLQPRRILEVGCNCGPNLRLLSEKMPDAELVGIDINPMAIEKGKAWFEREGISNVTLMEGKADALNLFENGHFDLVFSDAVLIYFGPDMIEHVAKEMFRVSGKAIILLEWNDFSDTNNALGVMQKHWVRNYDALLKSEMPSARITTEKIPEDLWDDSYWRTYGALVDVRFEEK